MPTDRPTVSESERLALLLEEDASQQRIPGSNEVYADPYVLRAAAAQIRELEGANARLREFANRIIFEMQTEEDVQDIAEECGLLEPVEATEPCDPEQCVCAEFDFPSTCFRRTALLAHNESEDRNG